MFILPSYRRWTQKWPIYFVRNNIHIINLEETVPLLTQALSAIREVAAGGRYYLLELKSLVQKLFSRHQVVNTTLTRWLGGMMTNFSTVSTLLKGSKN